MSHDTQDDGGGPELVESFARKLGSGEHHARLLDVASAWRDGEFTPRECRDETVKVLADLRREARRMERLIKLAEQEG